MNEETRTYLKDLPVSSMVNAGSSLKFCRLAEGAADLYPRFAPTMEWDTAAGHAILVAAGGNVTTTDGQPFRYGKSQSNYLNCSFIARARPNTGAKTTATAHSKVDALIAHLHTVVSKQAIPSEPADQIQHSDQFSVYLIWMGNEPLLPQRTYVFSQQDIETTCSITALKYRLNPANDEHLAANSLDKYEIANCNIELGKPISYLAAQHDKVRGKFSLKDKQTGEEVAIGLIHFGLRRATNIRWQALEINKHERALAKKQKPQVIWFTGLSGSGKSTIASLLEKELHSRGCHTYIMDGDNVRHGLCRDLGFTDADRVENIRRIAETARLFVDAGLIVLVSFISPFISERRMARDLFEAGEFREVFVDTPLEICEQRDPKGLYRKARMGEIKNFTGLDSPYEEPENADIVLSGGVETPEQQVNRILRYLDQNGLI